MTELQAGGTPALIVAELERDPERWFTMAELPIAGSQATIKRSFHRLINDKLVNVRQAESESNTGARITVSEISAKPVDDEDLELSDPDPHSYLLDRLGNTEVQCPTCKGRGIVSGGRTPKGTLAKEMGFTNWYQLLNGHNDQIKVGQLIKTKETFGLKHLEQAMALIVTARALDEEGNNGR